MLLLLSRLAPFAWSSQKVRSVRSCAVSIDRSRRRASRARSVLGCHWRCCGAYARPPLSSAAPKAWSPQQPSRLPCRRSCRQAAAAGAAKKCGAARVVKDEEEEDIVPNLSPEEADALRRCLARAS